MTGEMVVLNERYQLLQRIGSGGMSAVYKAEDRKLGRLVAVKMLHASLTSDQGFLERFQHEAHAAANLSHPNIVTVHDIGRDNHAHYIVMEYVEGETLKAIVKNLRRQGKPMTLARALDFGIQICAGIGYAHRAGLVHCDIKPQNVLVTRDDRLKVADFGIAQAVTEATRNQVTSQVWGTPHYFSPEQAAGQAPTPASDVYAIGVVMYELLTGQLPFQASTHTALALKHLNELPPPISESNPAVPEPLEQIIHKVLAKEPASRYRTAGQLGRILASYRKESLQDTGSGASAWLPAVRPEQEEGESPFLAPVPREVAQENYGAERLKRAPQVADEAATTVVRPAEESAWDWKAVALGILALLALLGLIPVWYLAWLAWLP